MTGRLSLASLLFAIVACGESAADAPAQPAREPAADALADADTRYPVEIETPPVLRGLAIGAPDVHGQPTVVPCATCHLPGEERPLPTSTDSVDGPHAGLSVSHGDIACGSCHHPSDRGSLRLADGTAIPLVDAMRLCSQCHGPQARDYERGAHGGMRGHWDLARGSRERNHCVSCHDPHGPRFGSFEPAPPPRDRFLPSPTRSAHE